MLFSSTRETQPVGHTGAVPKLMCVHHFQSASRPNTLHYGYLEERDTRLQEERFLSFIW